MTERAQVAQAGRVVVKVGSSSLTTAEGGIDPDRLAALVDALAGVRVTSPPNRLPRASVRAR